MKTALPAIPPEEAVFDVGFAADGNGRLFRWSGELYRAIPLDRAEFCRDLFAKGIVQELAAKGLLVETALAPCELEGFGAVLRHSTIPFVSYPHEWCGAMLRDAALLTLDLEIELCKNGLTLQDGHPWNVLFQGAEARFVDFGSIGPASPGALWVAHDEFCRFFFHPLLLIQHGHGRIARALLHDHIGVTRSELLSLVPDAPPTRREIILGSRLPGLQRLREQVASIDLPLLKTDWTGYYESRFPSFAPAEDWTPKHRSVYSVLSETAPASVIDLGANRGWYSRLAASLGHRVVATDVDETCITALYQESRGSPQPVLPLLMDFRYPSPAYGIFSEQLPCARQRLRCSIGLALALAHHLVFKSRLRFEQIAHGLSLFAADRVLVEFVPPEDRFIREWCTSQFSWYTLDAFVSALQQEYRSVQILPSYPEPRVLLLCAN